MGGFAFFRGPDINQGLKEFQSTANAVLLDVRTPQEYLEGHLPESRNVPLPSIRDTELVVSEKETPRLCILPQRLQKPSGLNRSGSDGICQREKHWRDCLLHREGGALI